MGGCAGAADTGGGAEAGLPGGAGGEGADEDGDGGCGGEAGPNPHCCRRQQQQQHAVLGRTLGSGGAGGVEITAGAPRSSSSGGAGGLEGAAGAPSSNSSSSGTSSLTGLAGDGGGAAAGAHVRKGGEGLSEGSPGRPSPGCCGGDGSCSDGHALAGPLSHPGQDGGGVGGSPAAARRVPSTARPRMVEIAFDGD